MNESQKRDSPRMTKILKVHRETPTVTRLELDRKADGGFGQFYMVWIPGVGERPYASSNLKGNMHLTVRVVGPFSETLAGMKQGDLVGIRGPYGKGVYKPEGDRICFIAGGLGIVPLIGLIESGEVAKRDRTVILGAKSSEELLYMDRLKETGARLVIATDDGSAGFKGFCHQCLLNLLGEGEGFDQILCCGPEVMMKAVMGIALERDIPCQLSLERYMKCGIGICGSCALDPSGLLVCRDGPVFDAKFLSGTEFGSYRRDAAGSKINL